MSMTPGDPCVFEGQAHIQRKTLSPISRLPSELLSAIFIHCAQLHYEAIVQINLADETHATRLEAVSGHTRGVPESVNISYVCRRWRDIALNCSTLWSYILPTSQRWIEVFLSRSRQALLRIHLKWKKGQAKQICLLERVLHHTERIQELKLRIPSHDYQSVTSLFSSPAPLLQFLTIEIDVSIRIPTLGGYRWSLFDGVVPALRRLQLSWCPTQRLPSMLNNLTTCILRRSFRGTIAELIASLRFMPSLVHLDLRHPIYLIRRDSDTPSTNDIEELRLPHLLRLIIYEHMSNLVSLLPLLIFSPQTEVKIRTYREATHWILFRSLLVNKFFAARDTLSPSIQTLAIEVDTDSVTTISFNGSELTDSGIELLNGARNIPLQIVLDDREEDVPYTVQHILQYAYQGGYLADLQNACVTLQLWGAWECDNFLEDLLGFIPELRSISLMGEGRMLGCLCSFLSFTPHDRLAEREDNTDFGFAPSLEELVIEEAIFDRESDFLEQPPHSHFPSPYHLYNALAIRKKMGYAIKRLTFSQCCNLFKEDVADLKDLVGEVFWDGVAKVSGDG